MNYRVLLWSCIGLLGAVSLSAAEPRAAVAESVQRAYALFNVIPASEASDGSLEGLINRQQRCALLLNCLMLEQSIIATLIQPCKLTSTDVKQVNYDTKALLFLLAHVRSQAAGKVPVQELGECATSPMTDMLDRMQDLLSPGNSPESCPFASLIFMYPALHTLALEDVDAYQTSMQACQVCAPPMDTYVHGTFHPLFDALRADFIAYCEQVKARTAGSADVSQMSWGAETFRIIAAPESEPDYIRCIALSRDLLQTMCTDTDGGVQSRPSEGEQADRSCLEFGGIVVQKTDTLLAEARPRSAAAGLHAPASDEEEVMCRRIARFLCMAYEDPDAGAQAVTVGERDERGFFYVDTFEKMKRYTLLINALALQKLIVDTCTQRVLTPAQLQQLKFDTRLLGYLIRVIRAPDSLPGTDLWSYLKRHPVETTDTLRALVGQERCFNQIIGLQTPLNQLLTLHKGTARAVRVSPDILKVPNDLGDTRVLYPTCCLEVSKWETVGAEEIRDMLTNLGSRSCDTVEQSVLDRVRTAQESFKEALAVFRLIPEGAEHVVSRCQPVNRLCKPYVDVCTADFEPAPRAESTPSDGASAAGSPTSSLASPSTPSTIGLLSPLNKKKKKKEKTKEEEIPLVLEEWMKSGAAKPKGGAKQPTAKAAGKKGGEDLSLESILAVPGPVAVYSKLPLQSGVQFYKYTVDERGTLNRNRCQNGKPTGVRIFDNDAEVRRQSEELARKRREAFAAEPTDAKKNKKQQASAAAAGAGSSMAARTDADDLVLSDALAHKIYQSLYTKCTAEGAPERIYPCILQYADRQRRCCLTHKDGRVQVCPARDYKHAPRIQQAWDRLVGLIEEIGLDGVAEGQKYEGPGLVREEGPDAREIVFNRTGFRTQYLKKK